MKARMLWPLVCLALGCVSIPAADVRVPADDRPKEIQTLIGRGVQAHDPVVWARYMMQADKLAEKLERFKRTGCCGYRFVRGSSVELLFRYNEIQGKENYQHDLLQTVARARAGEPEGAEALVRMLPGGCETIASIWTPYFRTVLSILETRQWRAVADQRLLRMRAEAYETWWSLSKLTADDVLVTDDRLDPQDFADGAEQARERAITLYRKLLRAGGNEEKKRAVSKLVARQDTQQRAFVCAGD